ncbi:MULTISPECIES: SDR family oxidoreductase [Nitrospirillum]|uniref:NAD(P)-dependent dehydrogenase (Short-subunit alcohol dehydrogenase family) n=1 Tax=Nitrospirillum amazonense TaxID=28077 RepID=A0A560J498_9PROT|nr:SDR family oxidoreductase [Nitrospirillum amazonense]TWB18426.1 NAD(P)-dependent dehydrogenase (short-subunit alcohol dehydrogenase family) [Nitrospirillum amazonense]TWB25645.1 NAD(P)-dependent dehydrogenase (short-subunit alcohol dehydrogenase family) [Nitrospirillum amazonense]TWB66053.1 NAD(P)-dependent dehydrogenase (short-subunit alcohol dehydrogenase family) [Nitrospirillum amazonense]
MARTVLVTGSASGIGLAVRRRLEAAGDRVIGADIRDAEIEADLATADGRRWLVERAHALAPEGLDGVVANAGISRPDRPEETLAVNYFGAVATLEGLRPLLALSSRGRAVATCSTAALLPVGDAVAATCLTGDEAAALAVLSDSPEVAYPASKKALALWLRRTAVHPEWAGAGILLNGVAPGVVETPMTAQLLADAQMRAVIDQTNPMAVPGFARPDEIAELIIYLLGFEGHYLLGQIIFNDGGTDALMRPDRF